MEERFNMRRAAELIPYSKRNFLRLKSEGFFPPARMNGSGQPYYTMVEIERCRQITQCGVGHNGEERNLYGGRSGRGRNARRKQVVRKEPVPPVVDYIVKRLGDFGVDAPKSKVEAVSKIVQELFAEGDAPKEMATVIKVAKLLRPTGSGGLDTRN